MKRFSFCSLLVASIIFSIVLTSCEKDKDEEIPIYSVTFDSKGGSQVTSQTVREGDLIEKPSDPTYENHSFSGWSRADNETSSLWNFETEIVVGDMTLFARWALDTYSITFDSDGGSAISAQNIAHGDIITKPIDPTRDGYVFDGWFHNDTEWDFATITTTSITLKAKWTEIEYFTIQDATVHKGTVPFLVSGISIKDDINMNHYALTGGSSIVSIATKQKVSEIYVGIKGVNYYHTIASQSSPLRSSATINDYSFIILFSQNLDESFEMQISARLEDGSLTDISVFPIQHIRAGTGSLQVNLSFDNDKDLDLYVVQPDGEIIFFGNRGYYYEEAGVIMHCGLDIDSNPMCEIDGINSENVFFPSAFIQTGKYEVWVNMWRNCDPSIPTNWVVTAQYEGALISTNYGRNPAQGVFPVGTPNNPIGGTYDDDGILTHVNLNGATKVMEFTLSGNSLRSMKPNHIERSLLTESAKAKLRKTGRIVEE